MVNEAGWQVRFELVENVINGTVYHREVPSKECCAFSVARAGPYVVYVTAANADAKRATTPEFQLKEGMRCTVTFCSERQRPGKGDATVACQ
ncbi:MAG: hypothetical protein ACK4K2_05275 [Dehalococcoidia bacterium]